jgi:phosphoglucosamine mutase
LQKFKETPQILVNLKADSRQAITDTLENKAVKDAIIAAEQALGASGRIVVRGSGTEPLLRIMVEAEDAKDMQEWADKLEQVMKARLDAAID